MHYCPFEFADFKQRESFISVNTQRACSVLSALKEFVGRYAKQLTFIIHATGIIDARKRRERPPLTFTAGVVQPLEPILL